MGRSEESALDRFLTTRGTTFGGSPADAIQMKNWTVASVIQTAFGLFLSLMAVGGGSVGGVVWGILFTWIGAMSLMMSLLARRQTADRATTGDVRLTAEARRLLADLTATGSALPGGAGRPAAARLRPEAFQPLETAAFEYNRLQAALAAPEPNASLARLGPNIRAAADETIAELLDAAAQIQQYPESASRHAGMTAARVAELRELADYVEQLAALREEPARSTSRLTEVLGLLRHDMAAREELELTRQPAAEPEPVLRQKVGGRRP